MHEWGLVEIHGHPPILAFLLDRASETSRIGKEWRYSVVQTMAGHDKCHELMGELWTTKLKSFVREGPFFVVSAPVIAMESG
jgi:hypothetical protein